jgi:hypothetical protein
MALKRVGMLVIALAALWSVVAPPVSGPDSAFDLSVTAAYAGDPDDYQGAPPPPPPDSTTSGDHGDDSDSKSSSTGGGSLFDKVTRFIASLLP